MPPPPSQWFGEIGLADFDSSAVSDIQLYARAWAQSQGAGTTQEDSVRAFIELGATEFAMAPLYRGGLITGPDQMILSDTSQFDWSFPIRVSVDDAADAVYETDCGPFMDEHLMKASSALRPWDVFTFSGSMSKFELLAISEDINTLADPKVMQAMVDGLAERYSRAGIGSRVVESGLLAAQGLVWFAKLALLRGEDYTQAQDLQFAARFLRGPAVS
jgi:hypothetical protein